MELTKFDEVSIQNTDTVFKETTEALDQIISHLTGYFGDRGHGGLIKSLKDSRKYCDDKFKSTPHDFDLDDFD